MLAAPAGYDDTLPFDHVVFDHEVGSVVLLVLHPYCILAPVASPLCASAIVTVALYICFHVVFVCGFMLMVGAALSNQ